MYKFSANLGLLWTEMSQIDAIYKAKDKGFDAVEFQFPYQYDSQEIKKALETLMSSTFKNIRKKCVRSF